ncbi:unnamed protein product [Brassica oleracea var. botrytis]
MGDLFAKSFSLKPRRLTRHISSRVLSDESLILAKVSLPSSWISGRFGVFGIIVFISVLINNVYKFYVRFI